MLDGILFPQEIAKAEHKDISEFGGWREYVATMTA